jgi:hypothetical protein
LRSWRRGELFFLQIMRGRRREGGGRLYVDMAAAFRRRAAGEGRAAWPLAAVAGRPFASAHPPLSLSLSSLSLPLSPPSPRPPPPLERDSHAIPLLRRASKPENVMMKKRRPARAIVVVVVVALYFFFKDKKN